MEKRRTFDDVLDDIKSKKSRKETGKSNGVPFPFRKWHDYIPSFDKGMYLGFLAGTGTGKSRLIRHILYEMYDFSTANNYPIKVLYFALEDGKIPTYKKILTHYLSTRHNMTVPPYILDSKTEPLSKTCLDIIESDRDFFDQFERSVSIINDCTSPNQIYEKCKLLYEAFGDTHHLFAIIDNYSNITRDSEDKSEWEAVKMLSRNKIRLSLCKEMGFTVMAVLQTDLDTERNSFRGAGSQPISSIEPNISSLGDNKIIARDFFYLFGLFNPWRYEITRYPKKDQDASYNIDVLRNRFRSLLMLKNNEGEMAPRLGLYFDGLREIYSELPDIRDTKALHAIYERIINEERSRKQRILSNNGLF